MKDYEKSAVILDKLFNGVCPAEDRHVEFDPFTNLNHAFLSVEKLAETWTGFFEVHISCLRSSAKKWMAVIPDGRREPAPTSAVLSSAIAEAVYQAIEKRPVP